MENNVIPLPGMPAVITLTLASEDKTAEGVPIEEAAQKLEAAGAAVVGINCQRGPQSIIPPLIKIKEAVKVKMIETLKDASCEI